MNSKEQTARNRVAGCGGFDNPFSPTYQNPLNNPYSFENLKLRNRADFALKHDPKLKHKIEHFVKNSDQFKISPIRVPSIRNSGTDAGQIMAGALIVGAGTAEIPPIAVTIVVGGAIVAAAVIVWNKISGYGDPTKWVALSKAFKPNPVKYHTTLRLPSQEPGSNPPRGFDPNNWPNDVGKAIKLLLAGVGVYQLYDIYDSLINKPLPAKKDSTSTNKKLRPYDQK